LLRTIIPQWNEDGALPPVDPFQPASVLRSPYLVSLKDVVLRFSTSRERRSILRGLLRYRLALHEAGCICGFQWIDGSFAEHVERLEDRCPNDVDVVTFLAAPCEREDDIDPVLFDQAYLKKTFQVDGYYVESGLSFDELVQWTAYWYALWSHRRSQEWKGFLQIDLDAEEDAEALELLNYAEERGE